MKRRMLVWLGVGLGLLALGAGIAYAATGGVSSGSPWVTQRRTFTVPVGQTVGDVLPLTGITVGGRCALDPNPDFPVFAWAVFEAADGKTMDAFATKGGFEPSWGTLGGTSFTVDVGAGNVTLTSYFGGTTVVATSNDAIATVTIGGVGDVTAQTCTFLWQAIEVPSGDSGPPGIAVPVPEAPSGP